MVRFLVLIAILNGLISPFVIMMLLNPLVWMPHFLLGYPQVMIYLACLSTSSLTLLVAGVPAALYERMTGQETEEGLSVWIWFAGVVLLTLPGIHNLMTGGVTLF